MQELKRYFGLMIWTKGYMVLLVPYPKFYCKVIDHYFPMYVYLRVLWH